MEEISRSYLEEQYSKLTTAIIELQENDILTRTAAAISLARETLGNLRKYILTHRFPDEQSEIYFFKEIKPSVYNELLYQGKVFYLETRCLTGSLKGKMKYLNVELERLEHFSITHMEFIRYYRRGANHLDSYYFLRGKMNLHETEAHYLNFDPEFSTGYDILLAKLIMNERLITYIHSKIKELNGQYQVSETHSSSGEAPVKTRRFAQTSFGGKEIYIFLKALIDSEGILNHTYRSFFEWVVPGIANKQHRSFSPETLLKKSDKVDYETRENVKRFLQRMMRNIDNY